MPPSPLGLMVVQVAQSAVLRAWPPNANGMIQKYVNLEFRSRYRANRLVMFGSKAGGLLKDVANA